jgi:uncharacterized protein
MPDVSREDGRRAALFRAAKKSFAAVALVKVSPEPIFTRRHDSTMIYTFVLLDKPDAAALRQRVRPEHKAYLGAAAERIAFAGPLVADDGTTMIGSLLAIDFDSRDAAHAWLAKEPFFCAGLYASTTVHAFSNLWPQKAGFPPAN